MKDKKLLYLKKNIGGKKNSFPIISLELLTDNLQPFFYCSNTNNPYINHHNLVLLIDSMEEMQQLLPSL
jgi:hypothetical protein